MVGAFTAGRGKLAVSFKKGSEGFCTMGGKIEGRFCVLISCDEPEQFPVGGGRDDSVSIWWGRTGLVHFWRGGDAGFVSVFVYFRKQGRFLPFPSSGCAGAFSPLLKREPAIPGEQAFFARWILSAFFAQQGTVFRCFLIPYL